MQAFPIWETPAALFHEFIDGFTEIINGLHITYSYRIHDTVAHMVLEDHFAGIFKSGPDGCQLDQHFGTVMTLFHHPLHLFKMTDGPGETVDHRFLVFVDMDMPMGVGMGNVVGMKIGMVVFLSGMVDVFGLVGHMPHLLSLESYSPHYTGYFPILQAHPGDISTKINTLTEWHRTDIIILIIAKRRVIFMHLDHDHIAGAHTHEHEHTHTHEHTHDGVTHTHEHTHVHSHEHEHPHIHDHIHEEGAAHTHGHDCSQNCGSCAAPCEHTPKEELMALMKYMVGHNASHARELAGLAQQLEEAGEHAAYEQVMAAVSDFEKGNMRLSVVLNSMNG